VRNLVSRFRDAVFAKRSNIAEIWNKLINRRWLVNSIQGEGGHRKTRRENLLPTGTSVLGLLRRRFWDFSLHNGNKLHRLSWNLAESRRHVPKVPYALPNLTLIWL